jgi:hypothetical protein
LSSLASFLPLLHLISLYANTSPPLRALHRLRNACPPFQQRPKASTHTYALLSFIPDADADKYLLARGSMTPEMSERKKREKRRELGKVVEVIWLRKTNVVTSPLADRLVERVDTKMLAPHLPSVNV